MITLTLRERLFVQGVFEDEEGRGIVEALKQRFIMENPVYWDARRNRRPCKHIPRKIELIEFEGDLISLPRGAVGDVQKLLAGKDYRLVDMTALPEAQTLALLAPLRPYQKEGVQQALEHRQGVIHAPTGSGKTVMALGIVAGLSTRALILVHTSVLLEQTVAKVRQFLGIEPEVIRGDRFGVGRVTVAMVQTLRNKDSDGLRDSFGVVILDEAHHCPAYTFQYIVQKFSARYRIGLTATPTRKDKLHPILFDVMGPIIYEVSPDALLLSGSLVRLRVVKVQTRCKVRGVKRNDYQKLIETLSRNIERNKLIAETVQKYHRHRSLVLSERIEHAHVLCDMLCKKGLKAGLLTGETDPSQRQAIVSRFAEGVVEILVATTALLGEGFDLPSLDTVFIALPHGNPAKAVQTLGRVLRPAVGKGAGTIVDFEDHGIPLLRFHFLRRMRAYREFMR